MTNQRSRAGSERIGRRTRDATTACRGKARCRNQHGHPDGFPGECFHRQGNSSFCRQHHSFSGVRLALSARRESHAEDDFAWVFALDLLKKQYNIFNVSVARSNPSQMTKILKRIASKGPDWAFTPHDFADFGDPRSIGMALTRLVRDGKIRRIGRGLYDKPHAHPVLGQVGAGTDAIVDAIARKKSLRVLPSSAVAANQLGLTTQVPAKLVYHTDGAPSEIHLGKLQIVFRRNTGRMLGLAGRPSGLVAQALREFGKDGVTETHLSRLRDRLSDTQKRQLLKDIDRVPAWMRPHFKEIAAPVVPT